MNPMSVLVAARSGILVWLTVALIPFEIVYDAIEDEIARRRLHDRGRGGVSPRPSLQFEQSAYIAPDTDPA